MNCSSGMFFARAVDLRAMRVHLTRLDYRGRVRLRRKLGWDEKVDHPKCAYHAKTLPSLRLHAFAITDSGIRNATK